MPTLPTIFFGSGCILHPSIFGLFLNQSICHYPAPPFSGVLWGGGKQLNRIPGCQEWPGYPGAHGWAATTASHHFSRFIQILGGDGIHHLLLVFLDARVALAPCRWLRWNQAVVSLNGRRIDWIGVAFCCSRSSKNKQEPGRDSCRRIKLPLW